MNISRRLKCVADFIEDGSSVFDIGADHGNLEIFLSNERHIKHILAVDNKVGPFEILKENTKDLENVEVKLSSGLTDYQPSFDTVVIAGMGGQLIISILKEHPEYLKSINHLIVDPHKNIDEVRKVLPSLGFVIKEEKIVKENNHYYFVIHFIKGEYIEYSDEQLEYGVNVLNKDLLKEYIAYDKKRKLLIESKIKGEKNENN